MKLVYLSQCETRLTCIAPSDMSLRSEKLQTIKHDHVSLCIFFYLGGNLNINETENCFQNATNFCLKYKHSRQCLNTLPNNSKCVKNTPLRVVFSTLFSVFGNVVKHGPWCLIYIMWKAIRSTVNISPLVSSLSVIWATYGKIVIRQTVLT